MHYFSRRGIKAENHFPPARFSRIWIGAIKLTVVAGALTYLIWGGRLRWEHLWFPESSVHVVALGAILILLSRLLSFVRYGLLVQTVGLPLGTRDVIRIGFIGIFFNMVLSFGGAGGEVVKLGYVARETGDVSGSVASVIMDRFCGIVGILVLGMVAVFYNRDILTAHSALYMTAFSIVGTLAGVALCSVTSFAALSRGRVFGLKVWVGILIIVGLWGMYAFSGQDRASATGDVSSALLTGPMIVALGALLFLSLSCLLLLPSFVAGGRAEGFVRDRVPMGEKLVLFVQSILAYIAHPVSVLAAIGLSVLLHGLLVTSIYLFGLALLTTSTAGFEEVLFAAPVAMLTMILPLPAGGLGVGELAFDQVLITAATVKGAAGVFLFFRCLGMLLNLVGLPFYLWNKRVRGNAPS